MKKDHPILFSTPMIQAILEGRKTQTRRVARRFDNDCTRVELFLGKWQEVYNHSGKPEKAWMALSNNVCPYGNVGDVLWVRESWNASTNVRPEISEPFIYKADRSEIDGGAKWAAKWKPSIHMPKAACRLFLEITSVRVERLQDISEADAIAEGIEPVENFNSGEGKYPGQFYKNYLPHGYTEVNAKASFQSLWGSINGEESFKNNPWVWVVAFKQIKQTA